MPVNFDQIELLEDIHTEAAQWGVLSDDVLSTTTTKGSS